MEPSKIKCYKEHGRWIVETRYGLEQHHLTTYHYGASLEEAYNKMTQERKAK